PRILAFDTSSSLCVCGVVEGERVAACEVGASPTAPSEGLLPMIHRCLEGAGLTLADLDAVVPGRGPGSFTGTRIALSTAKGIALGSGLPIVAVSSLEAAAIDAGRTGPVVVALDARKGEILISAHAWSEAGGLCTLLEPELVRPDEVQGRIASLQGGAGVPVRGDAPASYPEAFRGGACEIEPDGSPLVSSPLSLVRLAMGRIRSSAWDDPDVLEPLYSRPPPVHRAGRRD
ncbi:MAG: tRNA (adenosine(37)-N6)-threonylcarbamoyltransferase complex dimerization subunit type 1 TsaB, partial [Deltaproteobacteria bacterium]|nr:tRNA (adenosine(37)-N6)-threonylcarbamoyltransferase complex dimerization subunit type 1 TsaB [Deltaproteobacteria bacterium]